MQMFAQHKQANIRRRLVQQRSGELRSFFSAAFGTFCTLSPPNNCKQAILITPRNFPDLIYNGPHFGMPESFTDLVFSVEGNHHKISNPFMRRP